MKKHHLINVQTGNCFCGIESTNQLIAFNDGDEWFDSMVYPIDHTNYNAILCVNCMKHFDIDLIDHFEMNAFLIDYANRIPNGKRSMKFFKSQSKRKRQSIDRTKPTIKEVPKTPAKTKPIIQSKPTIQSSIPKTAKGKARAKKKAINQLKATDTKCKVINKPKKPLIDKPKDDVIELKNEVKKPLIDLSKGPVKIESIEVVNVDPSDDWSIGDPINDDTIFELIIGNDWKLIRHDEQLNEWKFFNRQSIKGVPEWIDDSEWLDYTEAAELINDGYCE
jgi:hypothetical protein